MNTLLVINILKYFKYDKLTEFFNYTKYYFYDSESFSNVDEINDSSNKFLNKNSFLKNQANIIYNKDIIKFFICKINEFNIYVTDTKKLLLNLNSQSLLNVRYNNKLNNSLDKKFNYISSLSLFTILLPNELKTKYNFLLISNFDFLIIYNLDFNRYIHIFYIKEYSLSSSEFFKSRLLYNNTNILSKNLNKDKNKFNIVATTNDNLLLIFDIYEMLYYFIYNDYSASMLKNKSNINNTNYLKYKIDKLNIDDDYFNKNSFYIDNDNYNILINSYKTFTKITGAIISFSEHNIDSFNINNAKKISNNLTVKYFELNDNLNKFKYIKYILNNTTIKEYKCYLLSHSDNFRSYLSIYIIYNNESVETLDINSDKSLNSIVYLKAISKKVLSLYDEENTYISNFKITKYNNSNIQILCVFYTSYAILELSSIHEENKFNTSFIKKKFQYNYVINSTLINIEKSFIIINFNLNKLSLDANTYDCNNDFNYCNEDEYNHNNYNCEYSNIDNKVNTKHDYKNLFILKGIEEDNHIVRYSIEIFSDYVYIC